MSHRFVMVALLHVASLLTPSGIVRADQLLMHIHPEVWGPFPGGIPGQIPYTVSVEILDVESDGYDSQGIHGVGWNLLTDTGIAQVSSEPALTGETDDWGQPARVDQPRYYQGEGGTPVFAGGYGFEDQLLIPFTGYGQEDDVVQIGGWHPLVWQADVDAEAPGLQPYALEGIGIGERPASGPWFLASGWVNYSGTPGQYAVDLSPIFGTYILPDVDLSQDHADSYWAYFAEQDVVGDSFSFTVLPEPGSLAILATGLALLRRKKTAQR